jgi:ferredoxin
MLNAASRMGAEWMLDYCGRATGNMAFLKDLEPHRDQVRVHADGDRLDIPGLIAELPEYTVVYCCSPQRMLDEVERETAARGLTLHTEQYSGVEALQPDDVPFEVELATTGRTLQVGSDETILDVLTASGLIVHSACREGNCGSCETAVLAGDVEHRDLVLTPEQRLAGNRMMVCVSRAIGERIVLDL